MALEATAVELSLLLKPIKVIFGQSILTNCWRIRIDYLPIVCALRWKFSNLLFFGRAIHRRLKLVFSNSDETKFLYTKLRRPNHGIFVQCIALIALLKTLVYVLFNFIISLNTHSTNTTCAFNPWLQVSKWFGEVTWRLA